MKTIYFYLDEEPATWHSYDGTKKAIENAKEGDVIKTTSLANLTFELVEYGFKLYIVRNGIEVELYIGMTAPNGKEIRKEHNLMKLVIAKVFDDCFK